jgi:hypothetical protein
MDPNEYFVLNQKTMFKTAIENDELTRKKLNAIEIVLRNKFGKRLNNNPVESVKIALQIIATEKNHKDFSSLV